MRELNDKVMQSSGGIDDNLWNVSINYCLSSRLYQALYNKKWGERMVQSQEREITHVIAVSQEAMRYQTTETINLLIMTTLSNIYVGTAQSR
jgi:hypothetical protein